MRWITDAASDDTLFPHLGFSQAAPVPVSDY